jgi:hypothetical protein
MKRNLIAVVAAALALGTTAAFADNNYTFDDAYWKQSEGSQTVHAMPSIEVKRSYEHVDGFNN